MPSGPSTSGPTAAPSIGCPATVRWATGASGWAWWGQHLIGAAELARMADGSTLINTARGSLLDHRALTAELRTGRLSAVLDVTEPEPLPEGHELLRLPNAFITPHLAGSHGTELALLAELVLEELRRFTDGRPPLHPVTAQDLSRIA